MPYKDKSDPVNMEKARASRLKHYYANKDQYIDRSNTRKIQIRTLMDEIKDVPCMDCGNRFPSVCMDFDHRPGEEKLVNPSDIARRGWSYSRILMELSKCDVVCANCHRIRTRDRL